MLHAFSHSLSDGVGRTGTFICIHAQLERLKTEGVVDFFQSIKSARIQRVGLVSDIVSPLCSMYVYVMQLLHCHTHTHTHTHSNSTYSVTVLWQTILMDLILTLTSRNLFKIVHSCCDIF